MNSLTVCGVAAAGVVAGVLGISGHRDEVDRCIHAYYADMFNGYKRPAESPENTFVTCMKVAYESRFKEIHKKYAPSQPKSESS